MAARRCRISNIKYDDSFWLSTSDWMAYRKRVPVRYPQRSRPLVERLYGSSCFYCGGSGGELQLSHMIPFRIGVIDFGISPEWLDRVDNLRLAHRGSCNNSIELSDDEIVAKIECLGHNLEDSPAYLSGIMYLDDGVLSFRV